VLVSVAVSDKGIVGVKKTTCISGNVGFGSGSVLGATGVSVGSCACIEMVSVVKSSMSTTKSSIIGKEKLNHAVRRCGCFLLEGIIGFSFLPPFAAGNFRPNPNIGDNLEIVH
jgi:hypothetical protein